MSENLLPGMCTQRRFRSDCTFVQSDQNIHWAHGYFDNRIPLKTALGGVCSLANYSVAYGETQSNRVSDFRDFVRFLFPKAILFVFLLIKKSRMQSFIIRTTKTQISLRFRAS